MLVFVCLSLVVSALSQRRGPLCLLTTNDVSGPFFEESAPSVYHLAPAEEMLNHPIETFIYGAVMNSNCQPVPGATYHIWYAGDQTTEANPTGSVHYTFPPDKLWYRGKTITDQNGEYSFHGTFPGEYSGRPIIHYHVKVIAGGKEFVTQMYFDGGVPPSYEDYVKNRETQFPRVTYRPDGSRDVVFNVILDL